MRESATQIWEIIISGGPIMIALFLLAIILYRNLISLLNFLRRPRIDLRFSEGRNSESIDHLNELRNKLREIGRSQLRYAKVLLIAAPLLGLLGTVMGMLGTFKGLASSSNQETTTAVADGVKIALITTQTGLMIAIVGLFFTQWISRLLRLRDRELVDRKLELLKQRSQA